MSTIDHTPQHEDHDSNSAKEGQLADALIAWALQHQAASYARDIEDTRLRALQLIDDQEDHELITRALQGDESVFDQLRDKYWQRVLLYLKRVIISNDLPPNTIAYFGKIDFDDDGNPISGSRAYELAVECLIYPTFTKTFRELPSLDIEKTTFRSCLFDFAWHYFEEYKLEEWKKYYKRKSMVKMDSSVPEGWISDDPFTSDYDGTLDIPREYLLIFELFHVQKLAYADIAEKLGISVGTVKMKLLRARYLMQLTQAERARMMDRNRTK